MGLDVEMVIVADDVAIPMRGAPWSRWHALRPQSGRSRRAFGGAARRGERHGGTGREARSFVGSRCRRARSRVNRRRAGWRERGRTRPRNPRRPGARRSAARPVRRLAGRWRRARRGAGRRGAPASPLALLGQRPRWVPPIEMASPRIGPHRHERRRRDRARFRAGRFMTSLDMKGLLHLRLPLTQR